MLSTDQDLPLDLQYKLVRVEKADPPAGMQGDDWYRYVLRRKNGDIVGRRCGSYQQVSRYAEEFTEVLNARVSGVGSSLWTRHRKL
ncbi:MAG TPA: hypothetical protein VIR60_08035 [Gammaproteobacteria bacterium]